MSCINLSIPAPQLPPIFINFNFNFSFSLGQIGITCCTIKLPSFSLPIPLPSPGPIIAAAIKAINVAIQAAWPTLDLMIPNCPMNGAQL